MNRTLMLAALLAFSPLASMSAWSPVLAQEQPAGWIPAGSGPASITLQGGSGQTLSGRTFAFFRLFDAEASAGGESVRYTWNPDTETAVRQAVAEALQIQPAQVSETQAVDYVQSLGSDETALRQFLETVRDLLKDTDSLTLKIGTVSSDNSVTVDGLEYGWYLVDEQGTATAGQHAAASLLMVNTALPEATLKVKSDYPSVTKKILEDDGDTGWNDIGDFMYGQTIPYRYQTTVPEIGGYKTYLMRFQDRMDPALDLDPDSVTVSLQDGTRTYDLKESEFSLSQEEEGITFAVTIPDIKAICDREFPGEGYGQTVELRYDARFNDQILDRFEAGKNAFENTVRLEFSNDPDAGDKGQTGFTPWDTVVCYTYQINGLKINENDRTLANAGFRLYEDEACTREIGFVASEDAWLPSDTEVQEIMTDENGVFRLDGLDQGTYWLKETTAPAGYRPLQAPIRIDIQPEFVQDRDSYVTGGTALTDLKATADTSVLATVPAQSQVNLSVINRTGSLLPSTGSSLTLVLVAAAGGLAAAGFWLGRKKK